MDHEGKTSDNLIPSRWVIDFKRPELAMPTDDGGFDRLDGILRDPGF